MRLNMELLDTAIHETVHDSAIGSKEIAERMGKSRQVLLNKANPNNDTHHLTLHEAAALIKVTGNTAILDALIDLCNDEVAESMNISDALVHSIKESSDVSVAVTEAIIDDKLSQKELKDIHREIREAQDALKKLTNAVNSHTSKPTLKAAS
jgi:uncharacterized protein YfeS